MSGSQDEIPPPPPPPPSSPQTLTQQTPHIVSTIKLLILKKGEYDIWAMKMEHYLAHTDYPIWEVLPPRTAEEIVARERERKARTTLLMALPEDHLAKFHKMTDAKEMWDAIKSRFGGNDESKKMQKYILKQQFEGFLYQHRIGTSQWLCEGSKDKGNQDNRRRDEWNSGNKDGAETGRKRGGDSKSIGDSIGWRKIERVVQFGVGRRDERIEKWHNSSKNLSKLLNTQMSANDKFGLGYGDHRYDGILSYENEVLQSVFMNKESELEKQPLYDRFVTAGGMHAVPPPMTGNYMPSGPDIECMTVVNESNVECQPKVWSDAPIIEEYESDSEDEYVSIPTKEQETPSFANQQVKTPRETVKNQFTHSQKPKVDKKELGYGFTVRACFVCGSLNHLIRDCDFHEKRMARKAELNNQLNKNFDQREKRPIWNNVQRVNKQNQFVPSAVLTRTGKIPVNTARASGTKNVSTARQSFNRQTVLTSTAMKVNTVKPIVNRVRPANVFHKTHSPSSRPFKKTTVLSTNFSKQKVYTDKVNAVSAVGGKRETAIKPLAHDWKQGLPCLNFQDFNGGPVAFGGSKVISPGKNIVPSRGLACLIAKATTDESNKWHRRLGHVNFKNLNKLVKGNLVRGLPSKIFKMTTLVLLVRKESNTRPPNSRTRMLLNSVSQKGSRGNIVMPELHNKIELLKRKNRTLIEAARTMLADSFLPNTFADERGMDQLGFLILITYTDFLILHPVPDQRIKLTYCRSTRSYHNAGRIVYAVQDYRKYGIFVDLLLGKRLLAHIGGFIEKEDDERSCCQIFKSKSIKWNEKCPSFRKIDEDGYVSQTTRFSRLPNYHQEEILKKFDFVNVKTSNTPIKTQKPLVKDEEASDVDVHLYRSMIGSLMYLTAFRPDIMSAICACSRFQVTPKTSQLSAVKRIFRYLKGKPKLGLWYPRVSSFDLEAYSDSDYAGANLDRKSTTAEAEYVATANCCGQVLWIQNQMLDYGFNFINTKIYIDNESTICIVKNPVYHSKTKHIAIRHHFIRDAYEKKLIQVLKIHTDDNVADFLTKAFDVSRFQFLVVTIRMINP
ncbi:putative ribonuclease H-like domain-containing protein [Tanacetum coccineum]